ncbi:MAG: ABC transporter permease [Candidatus Omnitrophica bacterium]|nr:ABC transporter permease [Candidatus Omnitrophota bacterium]
MSGSLVRISAMLRRYLYLHRRSLPRTLELVFWPVMELFVWGYLTVYFKSLAPGLAGQLAFAFLNGMIFWDILYRNQQAVTISVMEEIWHHNLLNILISPLRLWEWLAATFVYGFLKSAVITGVLTGLAFLVYHFDLAGGLGLSLIPLVFNLLLFAWILGIATAALLLWWGYSAEALIWGIPFLVQPLSAVFYPLTVMPVWVQAVSRCLPSTYVFEGMRLVLAGQPLPAEFFWASLGLNGLFLLAAGAFFYWMYAKALESGRLVRTGME